MYRNTLNPVYNMLSLFSKFPTKFTETLVSIQESLSCLRYIQLIRPMDFNASDHIVRYSSTADCQTANTFYLNKPFMMML